MNPNESTHRHSRFYGLRQDDCRAGTRAPTELSICRSRFAHHGTRTAFSRRDNQPRRRICVSRIGNTGALRRAAGQERSRDCFRRRHLDDAGESNAGCASRLRERLVGRAFRTVLGTDKSESNNSSARSRSRNSIVEVQIASPRLCFGRTDNRAQCSGHDRNTCRPNFERNFIKLFHDLVRLAAPQEPTIKS